MDQFGWPAEEGSGYVYVVEGLGARGVPEGRYAADAEKAGCDPGLSVHRDYQPRYP